MKIEEDMEDKDLILEQVKQWFSQSIAANHIKNTVKLVNPNEFDINPFLTIYLAKYLTGEASAQSIARALILPRVLGTSITTSFGQNMQNFISILRESYGSTTSGVDIEFIDQIDGHRKYCQIKAGPNTINKDDVESITGHFRDVLNLARTNNLRIPHDDLIIGVLYGEPSDLNASYKRITKQYYHPIYTGKEFWHRLTGDEDFYSDLIDAITSVATDADFSERLEDVINQLASNEKIIALEKLN